MKSLFTGTEKQGNVEGKLTNQNSFHQSVEQAMFKEGELRSKMENYSGQLNYQDYVNMQQYNDQLNFVNSNPIFNEKGMDNNWDTIQMNQQFNNMNFQNNQVSKNDQLNQINNNMNQMYYGGSNINMMQMMGGSRQIHPSLVDFNNYLNQNNIKVDTKKMINEEIDKIEEKQNDNENEQMEDVYGDIIKVMEAQDDDRMKNSQFLKFIKQLNTGEIKLNEKDNTINENLNAFKQENNMFNDQSITDKLNNFDEIFGNINYDNYYKQSVEGRLFLKENEFLNKKENNINRVELAKSLLKQFKSLEARKVLEAEVQENRDNCEAWVLLGKIHCDMDNDEFGGECLKIGNEVDPYNLECIHLLGVNCTNNQMEEFDAMCYLLDYIKLHPIYSKLFDKNNPLLNPNIIKEEKKKQMDFYNSVWGNEEKMQNYDPSNYDELNHKLEQMHNAFYNEVVNLYDQIRKSDFIKDSDFYTAFGIACFIPNNNSLSIEVFRTAVEINPNDYSCWNKLGAILAHSNKFEDSIACYNKAIELKKDYLRCWANLGIAYQNQNNPKSAINCYFEALKIDNSNKNIWGYLRNIFSTEKNDTALEIAYKENFNALNLYLSSFP